MPVTVGVNFLSVVHASSNGITVAFPDVCKTPSPVSPLPLPYPNIAKTANAIQEMRKKSAVGGAVPKVSGAVGNVRGTVLKVPSNTSTVAPGTGQTAFAVQSEIQQLKTLLNQINSKMLALNTKDPDQWQAVMQEYAVAAAALYVTVQSG